MSRARVLCLGNRWRGDDGAGPAVARMLRADPPSCAEVRELTSGHALLDELGADGVPLVVVVDAIRSGAAPGTLHRLDTGDGPLPARLATASTHGLSVVQAVELARVLGRMPGRLVVHGVEAGPARAGEGLSPAVSAALPALAAAVRADLREGPAPGA